MFPAPSPPSPGSLLHHARVISALYNYHAVGEIVFPKSSLAFFLPPQSYTTPIRHEFAILSKSYERPPALAPMKCFPSYSLLPVRFEKKLLAFGLERAPSILLEHFFLIKLRGRPATTSPLSFCPPSLMTPLVAAPPWQGGPSCTPTPLHFVLIASPLEISKAPIPTSFPGGLFFVRPSRSSGLC